MQINSNNCLISLYKHYISSVITTNLFYSFSLTKCMHTHDRLTTTTNDITNTHAVSLVKHFYTTKQAYNYNDTSLRENWRQLIFVCDINNSSRTESGFLSKRPKSCMTFLCA